MLISWVRGALPVLAVVLAACGSSPEGVPTQGAAPDTDNPFRIGRTLIIPHAGGDGLFPENTLFAYEQSMAMGGDVVDIDVRLAADGTLVAFHDSTLDRTTNGTGPMNVLTAEELAGLDAGWRFERSGEFPFRGLGIGVPTVEEVLLAFPDALATLDLKDPGPAPVQPVCDLLRRLERTDDVYVGTETNDQPGVFRSACPELSTSGTSEERASRQAAQDRGVVADVPTQLVGQPRYIGSDGEKRVTAASLASSHAYGTAVLTWVVDDPTSLAELIDMGVDGIYTRRPDVMIDIMREMGHLGAEDAE